jgi:hypothetical protein
MTAFLSMTCVSQPATRRRSDAFSILPESLTSGRASEDSNHYRSRATPEDDSETTRLGCLNHVTCGAACPRSDDPHPNLNAPLHQLAEYMLGAHNSVPILSKGSALG